MTMAEKQPIKSSVVLYGRIGNNLKPVKQPYPADWLKMFNQGPIS